MNSNINTRLGLKLIIKLFCPFSWPSAPNVYLVNVDLLVKEEKTRLGTSLLAIGSGLSCSNGPENTASATPLFTCSSSFNLPLAFVITKQHRSQFVAREQIILNNALLLDGGWNIGTLVSTLGAIYLLFKYAPMHLIAHRPARTLFSLKINELKMVKTVGCCIY